MAAHGCWLIERLQWCGLEVYMSIVGFELSKNSFLLYLCFCFFQAEDGIRDLVRSRGLGDVYKRQIQGRPPHSISQSGLVHVPEGRGIFANLTVDENLMLGAYSRKNLREIHNDREMALDLFPRVRERLKLSLIHI